MSDWTFDTLKQHFDAIRTADNQRIDQRFTDSETAVRSALTAQKEQTAAEFAASQKAITKAEEAQKSYNATHNDLSRKMDEQYKAMMPRPEADSRFTSHDEKIQDAKKEIIALRVELMKEISSLRESRSEGTGEKGGKLSQQQLIVMLVGLFMSLLTIGGIVVAIAYAIRH